MQTKVLELCLQNYSWTQLALHNFTMVKEVESSRSPPWRHKEK